MNGPNELVAALLRIMAALTVVVLIVHALVCYNRAQLALKPYVGGFVWSQEILEGRKHYEL